MCPKRDSTVDFQWDVGASNHRVTDVPSLTEEGSEPGRGGWGDPLEQALLPHPDPQPPRAVSCEDTWSPA